MKVAIVGAGAVGFNLARTLSDEGHDVSVVERRAAKLRRLRDRTDVSVVEGSGTSAGDLVQAGVKEADLFIAVTEVDETNMVACALAHVLGTGRRIARIRNPDFAGPHPVVPKRTFGISRIINPDEVTISSLTETIMTPGVTDVGEFAEGKILLRGTVLAEDSPFLGVPLHDLRSRFQESPFLIAGIERGDELLIPSGDTVLEPRDHVFVILTREALPKVQEFVSGKKTKVERVVIYGGGRIGKGLAERLESRVDNVVMIEPDEELASKAAHALDRTVVLRGTATDPAILEEASLSKADYFVATSQRDEMNLVAAALIHRRGGPRVGVVTADPDFVPALADLNLDLVVNERLITVEAILRFVRPGRYLAVKRLNEQGAEIIELSVQKGSPADGKELRNMRLPKDSLVVAVHREGQAILPTGFTEIQKGDKVVLVALPKAREKAAKLFFDKRWVSLQKQHRR